MEMSILLLTTLLLSLLATTSQLCPCDTTTVTCDTHCCCDTYCTVTDIQSFTCPTYLLSDSKLCCTDSLTLGDNGVYQQTKHCSNNLVCLEQLPSDYMQYSNTTSNTESSYVNSANSRHIPVSIPTDRVQYHDTDLLLQSLTTTITPYLFPVPFHGQICAFSPITFYSNIISNCRARIVNLADACVDSMFDYRSYLTRALLTYPHPNGTTTNMQQDVTFYCLDPVSNVKTACSAGTPKTTTTNTCINVVKELHVKVVLKTDKMEISSIRTEVLLTSISAKDTTITQTMSLKYVPVAAPQTRLISGNFGYVRYSDVLSGRLEGDSIKMDIIPYMRPMSLFTSPNDCTDVEKVPVAFGVNQYAGCKLSLPFYNFGLAAGDKQSEYCKMLRNITGGVLLDNSTGGFVVGVTGNASVADPTQWVHVDTEPLAPPQDLSAGGLQCEDIITHRTYKVYYTEIGESENLQSVITDVKVELSRQNVVLYCGAEFCTSSTQQHVVLSNSVQFKYNTPSTVQLYKAHPVTSILLPIDFFYPLTSNSSRLSYSSFIVMLLYVIMTTIRLLQLG